jgi:hypothetical protein
MGIGDCGRGDGGRVTAERYEHNARFFEEEYQGLEGEKGSWAVQQGPLPLSMEKTEGGFFQRPTPLGLEQKGRTNRDRPFPQTGLFQTSLVVCIDVLMCDDGINRCWSHS